MIGWETSQNCMVFDCVFFKCSNQEWEPRTPIVLCLYKSRLTTGLMLDTLIVFWRCGMNYDELWWIQRLLSWDMISMFRSLTFSPRLPEPKKPTWTLPIALQRSTFAGDQVSRLRTAGWVKISLGFCGETIWPWVKTYCTIFWWMNIHLPSILMFARIPWFWPMAISSDFIRFHPISSEASCEPESWRIDDAQTSAALSSKFRLRSDALGACLRRWTVVQPLSGMNNEFVYSLILYKCFVLGVMAQNSES